MFHSFAQKLIQISFVFVIVCEIKSSEVPRPRGVSLAKASLYSADGDFTCLDGSLTIPFTEVNDDYCDCPDGTDEPGTAACPQGTFFCTNAGHKPLTIPSARVNDGICDCCDASDEYANSNAKCVNNCKELERSARAEAQKRAELVKLGSQIRAEMSQRGITLKQENKEKLLVLNRNRKEAEQVKDEKEALKKAAEDLENAALEHYRKLEEEERKQREELENLANRNEAIEVFMKYDSNKNGKLEVIELQTRHTFDQDRDGQVTEDEAKFYLDDQLELEFEDFLSRAWPKIKPVLMLEAGLFQKPEAVEDVQEDKGDGEDQEQQLEDQEYGEEEELEEEEEEEQEAQELEPEKEEPIVKTQYDEETQRLIASASEARTAFHDADKSYRDLKSEISTLEETLQKDFGPSEEFAVLQGECFEYTDREYIYKLCPFDSVVQKPKSGGSETRLGKWGSWAGPEQNRYEAMMYDQGQSCWNGPTRSTRVQIACGSDNVITGVSEPNRCEYVMDFTTPAACNPVLVERMQDDTHDEL